MKTTAERRQQLFAVFLQLELDDRPSLTPQLAAEGVGAFKELLENAKRKGTAVEDEVTEWYWRQGEEYSPPLGVCIVVLIAYAVYRRVWT